MTTTTNASDISAYDHQELRKRVTTSHANTNANTSSAGSRLSHVFDEVKHVEQEAIDLVKTLTWHQIEEWQKDNEYIVTGYRRVQNSWKGCFESLFGYLHNETVNIHSHLFGAILFLVFLITNHFIVVLQYPTSTWVDSAMFSVFLGSGVFCLTSSSFYHMASCHSEHMSKRCNALDYSGIVIFIVGSFIPSVYYAFFCEPFYQHLYISTFLVAGLGAAYIVLNPAYRTPQYRGARTAVFILLGVSSSVPVIHLLTERGLTSLREEMGLDYVLASGALYIFGALLYANRVPERFSPGTFDIFFASHQIFHFMVLLAALAHYLSVLKAIEHWHGSKEGGCLLSI